jgi:spore germination protein KC
MKFRTALIVFLFTVFPLTTGCWSRYEIESLAIVGGIGIDKVKENGQEKFQLTLNILRPGLVQGGAAGPRSGPGKPIYWRMMATGDTLIEAEKNFSLRASRRIFFGQTRFVIIGEKVAKEEMRSIIDYLHRTPGIRFRILLLATRGMASEMMVNYSELENTIAGQINAIAAITSFKVSKIKIENLIEVTDKLVTPGIEPVIARISILETPPTEPGGTPLKVFLIDGGGVIKGGALTGWMDDNETMGYMFVTGKVEEGVLPIKYENSEKPNASIIITRSSSKVKMTVNGDIATANVRIKAEGDLGEIYVPDKIATPEKIRDLEKYFQKAIEAEIAKSVNKAKELNADIFGFGEELYRSNPKEWKKIKGRWYEIFPNIKVVTNVTAHIRRTELLSNPYILKKEGE